MEKADVIKVRDTLKAGLNLPLVIYIDNTFLLIDESKTFQFTKWDDENGILYNYALTNPIKEQSPSNIGGSITLFAVGYEHIQAMEVSRLNLTTLEKTIDSIGTISKEWKDKIIKMFAGALEPNRAELSAKDINTLMGAGFLNDKDDYYNGRFTQSFAETVYTNRYNDSIKAKDDNTSVDNTESTEPNVNNTEG